MINSIVSKIEMSFKQRETSGKAMCRIFLSKKMEKRSLLRKSQRQKPKRTLKNLQTITTSKVPFQLITTTTSLRHHYIENGFLVDHYIKNKCLFSSSLLQKSERQKECEKNIDSLSFVRFSHFNCLWRKYLWRFWLFWC